MTNPSRSKTSAIDQPKELGRVRWLRDYDTAVQESKRTGKPILLLFQEIPGCSNCINFGNDLLSYPLFVEAIENEFIPLAIYNNIDGEDKRILEKFNEPAWNNPVVRFIDANGDDIVPKMEFTLDPFLFHKKMRAALSSSSSKVPPYFDLLADELKILYGFSKVTYYETPCFWSGETSLIQHPAALSTEAGWLGSEEVVKVHYDPEKSSLEELDDYATEQGFHLTKNHEGYRKDADPQYYLKGSIFASLPLSYTQRSVINYAIPYHKDSDVAESYLSPLQRRLLSDHREKTGTKKLLYDHEIESVWPLE